MIYTPGNQLLMADALSRATGQTKHPVSSSETEGAQRAVGSTLPCPGCHD